MHFILEYANNNSLPFGESCTLGPGEEGDHQKHENVTEEGC
jgi:hypothetical protein